MEPTYTLDQTNSEVIIKSYTKSVEERFSLDEKQKELDQAVIVRDSWQVKIDSLTTEIVKIKKDLKL